MTSKLLTLKLIPITTFILLTKHSGKPVRVTWATSSDKNEFQE